jgi:hypothetical protein
MCRVQIKYFKCQSSTLPYLSVQLELNLFDRPGRLPLRRSTSGQLQGVGHVECYMDAINMYIASTPLEKKNHNALRMLYGALNLIAFRCYVIMECFECSVSDPSHPCMRGVDAMQCYTDAPHPCNCP